MKLLFFALLCVGTIAWAGEPSGDNVWMQAHEPLTHAKVKKVLPDGILFRCDQGLVKARFDQLAPEWQAYYGDDAQRAAAKAQTNATEIAAILHNREASARAPVLLIGKVIERREDGFLIVQCDDTEYRESLIRGQEAQRRREAQMDQLQGLRFDPLRYGSIAPPAGQVTATGVVALRDVKLYHQMQLEDKVSTLVQRADDIELDGRKYPLYTVK